MEDHPVLRHVTPAPPHMRLSSLRGQGVVALEDHPTLRHVTGSPPLQLLQRDIRLEKLRELKKKKHEFIPPSSVVYELERES